MGGGPPGGLGGRYGAGRRRRNLTFSVGGAGGDNVDGKKEEEDVSEANTLASKASKLSAGARILRGP